MEEPADGAEQRLASELRASAPAAEDLRVDAAQRSELEPMPPAAAPSGSVLGALQERDFRVLYFGQTCSLLGDGAYATALAWFAYSLTGSATAVGSVLGALAVASLTSLLLGGALADRYDRRLMMIISDAGRFIVIALLALLTASSSITLPVLVALVAVAGLLDGLYAPAFRGIVPLVVRESLIGSANSLLGFAHAVGGVIGPALGGMLYAAVGPAPVFALCAVSSLAAVIATMLCRPTTQLRREPGNPFTDIAEGFRFVLTVPVLASIPVAALALMISDAPTQTLLPKLVDETFGGGSRALGGFHAALGIGSALGALAYGRLYITRHRAIVVYSIWAASHVICAIAVWMPSAEFAIALYALRGALGGFGAALWETLLIQIVPVEKLSRVASIDVFGCMALMPLGYALAAGVSSLAPAALLIAVGQLAAAAIMLSLLMLRRIREVQ